MKSLFSLLLGIAFCIATPCEAKAHVKHNKTKKIYVDPQTVKVTKNGIFLFKDGSLFPVEGVFKDEGGVFVVKERKRCIHACGNCGRDYDWNEHCLCPHCHHRH